jgi:RNA polymerase subunit RPABC4/transcription elongation factor Spt4
MVASAVPAMAAEGCTHILGEASEETKTNATVDPTCISEGYTLKACKLCGELVKTDVKAAKGHEFGDEATTLKTDDSGKVAVSITYKVCKNCGYVDIVDSQVDSTAAGTCNFNYYTTATDSTLVLKQDSDEYAFSGLSDAKKKTGTISICKTCGKVESNVPAAATADEHNFVLKTSKIVSGKNGTYTFICSDNGCKETLIFEAAPAECIKGEHVESTEKAGVCAKCGADVNAAAVTPATPSDEEPSEEPAETKVSTGTVVGGGIAAAGILTLITLIVKYLGSILF